MSRPLVIYHAPCMDGFTAAWVAWKALGDSADYHPAAYGQPPPDVTGRPVFIVDFSYKRPVLLEMASKAKSIVVLDHHKTAAADLAGFADPGTAALIKTDVGLWTRFDMNKSGARLAFDHFFPGDFDVPPLVAYVEDRDLYRHALPDSRRVNAWLFSQAYDFATWDTMHHELMAGIEVPALLGDAILGKHMKDVAELVDGLKHRAAVGGHLVWCANVPYTYSTEAGNLMAKGEPFACCYWDTPTGRQFSLRSANDGLDVAEIAAMYGGGGHQNAAGFVLQGRTNAWPVLPELRP